LGANPDQEEEGSTNPRAAAEDYENKNLKTNSWELSWNKQF